jgi:hypothetical protein
MIQTSSPNKSTTTTTETRALALLGQGIPPTAVANALGVDISRISQLLSDETFAAAVVEKKFEALSKHNERDASIDGMEDKLLEQLKYALPMMTRPMEIIRAFAVINAAKRRGQSAPEALTSKQTILQLNIPQILLQQFTTNVHNQVVQVGEQSLLTIPSAALLKTAAPAESPAPRVQNSTGVQDVRERKATLPAPRAPTAVGPEQRSSPQNA